MTSAKNVGLGLDKPETKIQLFPLTWKTTFMLATRITFIALVIIVGIGAAGSIPDATMRWLSIGFGAAMFTLSLAGDLKKRKVVLLIDALICSNIMTIGSLGIIDNLSGVHVSWGILVSSVVPFFINTALLFYSSSGQVQKVRN